MKRPEQSGLCPERTNARYTHILLTETDNSLTIYQSRTPGNALLMASCPNGDGIVRLNFTELGELINDLSLLRAKIMLDNETV